MARQLTAKEATDGRKGGEEPDAADFVSVGDSGGKVRYVELDAEKMGEHFDKDSLDCVWISEAMSHLPDKELFFRNASGVLKKGGKLVVADWFKADGLTDGQMEADIKPIEGPSSLARLSN